MAVLVLGTPSVSAATAQVTELSPPSGNATKFSKLEWTMRISKEYPNPFYSYDPTDTPQANPSNMTWHGVDGVTVDMVVAVPGSSNSIRVPGFYFQDYKRLLADGQEVLGKSGVPVWKFRYTPSRAGTYQYYVSIQDKEGTTRYPQTGTLSFTVADSNEDGFVRTSSKDSRFLAYDSGKPFVPIGAGQQWYPDRNRKSFSYEEIFSTFQSNGVNFLRIWDEFDFALGVEGAQTVWSVSTDPLGAARGVEIQTANVRSGLRAARPAQNDPWYQRVAVASPNVPHRFTAWVKYANLSGSGARLYVKTGVQASGGQIRGQSPTLTGTQAAWQEISFDFTPGADTLSVVLENNSGGQLYVDDVVVGPIVNSSVSYSILTDGDFERHFAKGNPGNDPDANRSLPRQFGNYMNPHTSFMLDKIIESAQARDVFIQLCSCSGPWFTWPEDPDVHSWSPAWVLKSWQRNFRYRVARWGYSPAVLAWEKHNEHGHIPPGDEIYTFYQNYGEYQKQVDIYGHLRTTSQNSQAYSPGLWSSNAMDLANYHDYLDFRSSPYTTLSNDEVNLIQRFAWCLRSITSATSSYCNGLGLGDGSSWTSGHKPWVWGEIGVQQNGNNIQGGEAGARFLHNIVWTGLFSPIGTTPLDWFQDAEDATSRAAKWAARKAASTYFSTVDYDGGKFVYFTTPNDLPPGYATNLDRVTTTNTDIRAYAMRREDRKAVYAWVQNRNHVWSRASTQTQPASATLTFPNLDNGTYTLRFFNTRTGQVTQEQSVSVSNNSASVSVSNVSNDIAIKIENTSGLPTVAPSPTGTPEVTPNPRMGTGDVNGDGTVSFADIQALFAQWYVQAAGTIDQYVDGIVNSFDYAVVVKNLAVVPSITPPTSTPVPTATPTNAPTPTPTVIVTLAPSPTLTPPPQSSNEWTQYGGNAQRTSFVPAEVPTPWRWKWAWNGPTSTNTVVSGKFRLPQGVQPVTGASRVYVAAGNNGVYALNISNGSEVWNARPGGAINSTVAYDAATNSVFAVSTNGTIYKLNSANGSVAGSYATGATSTFPLHPVVTDSFVAFSMGNAIVALNKTTMQSIWSYDAGSPVDTAPTYSSRRNLLIAGSRDLHFHAVNAATGARVWRVKPTVRTNYPNTGTYGRTAMGTSDAEVAYGWPVVSDQNDLVIVKYRLDWNTMWTWSPWPVTNAQMRSNLDGMPNQQSFFALDLSNGVKRFTMNLSHGGFGDGDDMPMGPMPVIKTLPDGNQVAYAIIRGDNRSEFDGRDDSKFGEVLLNNSTVSGYTQGEVRFIAYNNYGWTNGGGYSNMPTDEMPFLTMAGNHILGGHWMAGKTLAVENRDATRGSFSAPITSRALPHIVSSTNATATSGCSNSSSHYCSADTIYQEGDRRSFAGPSFYTYWGTYSPAVYDQFWTLYASYIVSNNLVIYRSTDGAVIALESGNPTARGVSQPIVAGATDSQEKASTGPDVIPFGSARSFVGQEKVVEGTVVSVFDNQKAVYITFTEPHGGNYFARISGDAYGKIGSRAMSQIKPGVTIRISGFIDMYQGDPVTYISDMSQITVVREAVSDASPHFLQRLFNVLLPR